TATPERASGSPSESMSWTVMRTTSPVTAVVPDAITVETSASGSTTGGCVGVPQAASSQASSATRKVVLFIHDLLSVRTTSSDHERGGSHPSSYGIHTSLIL